MKRATRLTQLSFTVRSKMAIKQLGFVTVGQLEDFLIRCDPNVKLGNTYAHYLIREINDLRNEPDSSS